MTTVTRAEALHVAASDGLYRGVEPPVVVDSIVEFRDPRGAIKYDLIWATGRTWPVYPEASRAMTVWKRGWAGWMTPKASGLGEDSQGLPEPSVAPIGAGDMFFLIGAAFGPHMAKAKDLSGAMIQIAQKIAAQLGDKAMVRRCEEMMKELAG